MAVTAYFYAEFFVNCMTGNIADLTAASKTGVTLHTSTYVPNQDTHNDGADATNEVAEANGYLQGFDATGEVITTPTVSNTLEVINWNGDDPQWTATGAGITARTMVLSDVTTAVAATDPLIWFSDFDGTDETASGGGTFTYTFGANIGTISPADATGFPA
jgi:type II secretory pathway pseudopilin PulG